MQTQKINVTLTGLRPMLFDRYGGTNSTNLKVEEKLYLDSEDRLTIPSINLYSMMVSENTKSVCKLFMGKVGRSIAHAISCFTNIEPYDIPLTADGKEIKFSGFNDQVVLHKSVARLNKGIPNPKERPMLKLPWELKFTINYTDNKVLTLGILRNVLEFGGTLGIGTFRPFFGLYQLTQFDVEK